MCGQALVPLTGPLLWDGLHKVPLKLADAGVMLQDVLVGLVEILQGTGRDDARGGWMGNAERWAPGNLPRWHEDQ